jgi:hypothetical protein
MYCSTKLFPHYYLFEYISVLEIRAERAVWLAIKPNWYSKRPLAFRILAIAC